MLTFNSLQDFRIRITFDHFSFENIDEYLEIGDGTTVEETTRLAHLTGIDLPSNVTSVSNAIWIRIKVRCGNRIPNMTMKLLAINKSLTGICKVMFGKGSGRNHNFKTVWLYQSLRLYNVRSLTVVFDKSLMDE